MPSPSHPLRRNLALFVAFRAFFNARWYYPVIAVLFLDFGLTLDQYALLNVVWALTILALEVPSGAVADRLGRRTLLILAAVLMVAEMALLSFAPLRSFWTFPCLLLNRVLSGAAEASASGADESLAFESLRVDGRTADWPAVLASAMRWQSALYFVAMLVGAALFDPALPNAVLGFFGLPATLTHEMTMRWPVFLSLGNALVVLAVTLAMREPPLLESDPRPLKRRSTWEQVVGAGRWIARNPLVLAILIAGLCLDSPVRLFLTMGSNYYRLIGLPEASFGAIGAGFAVLGFFTPRLAQFLVTRRTMDFNFGLLALAGWAGFVGVSWFFQGWGVLMALPLGIAMSLLQFFMSHYLNTLIDDPSQRATVLSFKGMLFNLGYAAAGLLFAAFGRARAGAASQDTIFGEAFAWMPWVFAVLVAGAGCFGFRVRRAQKKRALSVARLG